MTRNINQELESPLGTCCDCGGVVSRRAEHCPKCGRFFQSLRSTRVTPGAGWTWAVAWGIILSSVIVMIMAMAFWFFVFALLAGSMGGRR
jgi:hypothetical protein